ncbi:MAG: methyl-accepting chemotaxis protein, partial [Spirulinaceae cyanobacterium SM2_1_0]|nr:methyl-accepting chemotaxis protein [Spirulinaceae cyanobacterium SM2_1_0]
EVTADVLGAVADSFNLTINSLREIVSQVKQAATSVNGAAQQNESFARSLSADAMKQSDEVSQLLDSIQVMTNSIQDVATNSRQAESVAQRASQVAVEGGQAVDRTVMGILAIREKVAETTRQVKRLAESSQEISKIVALISQISSRTNLLALNASIEAARAGEAGKGFAIVADEVRQLADRAAKASKEIEQLVMQIQSETSLVMTAMEEGTQQVIEGTRLAEQAKENLEEIIQVNQTIDRLMRDITAATVQQTDTSREVSQVMQNTALNASETSREAARVAASLQELVSIARDLQTSVGKFRIGDETRAAL